MNLRRLGVHIPAGKTPDDIERVGLSGSALDDESLKWIALLHNLRDLAILGGSGNLQGPGLKHLSELHQLEILSLSGMDMTDAIFG